MEERCAVMNGGFIDCYDQLDGPYEVTLLADPPEGGSIELPTIEIDIDDYPFTTTYFGGINVDFDADENDGYIFSHWTANNNVILPDELSEEIIMNFTAADTLIAHFVAEAFFNVTLNVEPLGAGSIELNGTIYNTFPVTIELPGSTLNSLDAIPIDGWGFENWASTVVIDGGQTTQSDDLH